MTKVDKRPYWARFVGKDGGWVAYRGEEQGPPGAELAALRKGAGQRPGEAPSMWPFYTVEVDDEGAFVDGEWQPDASFAAEHHVLVLYAFHQQSRREPMHKEHVGLGQAVKEIHLSGTATREAVDRRFFAAVTADTVEDLTVHLRGLVRQLKSLQAKQGRKAQPLDYTQLTRDLVLWASPEARGRVRRRWGRGYQTFPGDTSAGDVAEVEADGGQAG